MCVRFDETCTDACTPAHATRGRTRQSCRTAVQYQYWRGASVRVMCGAPCMLHACMLICHCVTTIMQVRKTQRKKTWRDETTGCDFWTIRRCVLWR